MFNLRHNLYRFKVRLLHRLFDGYLTTHYMGRRVDALAKKAVDYYLSERLKDHEVSD